MITEVGRIGKTKKSIRIFRVVEIGICFSSSANQVRFEGLSFVEVENVTDVVARINVTSGVVEEVKTAFNLFE